MKKTLSHLLLLCVAIAMATVFPHSTSAATPAPAPKKPAPAARDTVTAVSDDSITISGKKGSHTYSISKFTRILVNGKHAEPDEIKTGMFVSVGAYSDGKASLISAFDPTDKPGAK